MCSLALDLFVHIEALWEVRSFAFSFKNLPKNTGAFWTRRQNNFFPLYCLIVLFQSSQIRLVSVLYCLYSLQSTFSLWKMFALFTPEKSLFLLSVGGDIFARKNLVFCQNVAIVSIGTTKAGTIKSCFVVKSLIHKISQIRSC